MCLAQSVGDVDARRAGTEVEVRELRSGKYLVRAAGFWSRRMTWQQVIAVVTPA